MLVYNVMTLQYPTAPSSTHLSQLIVPLLALPRTIPAHAAIAR